jgi:hypothetical protein
MGHYLGFSHTTQNLPQAGLVYFLPNTLAIGHPTCSVLRVHFISTPSFAPLKTSRYLPPYVFKELGRSSMHRTRGTFSTMHVHLRVYENG